ncbi:MAG TPA: cytidine deaminase [Candidatus Limnocylindria bacterium]|nr:cytidine deaminase [Candidatus Limnocylindria bacterium]
MTDDKTLLAAAVAARAGAYAPYSNFSVGAALLGRDGRVWTGANVENASYGLSMCAERNAVFAAVAAGARAFDAVAVTGPDGMTTMPCGACRQVLWEFAPELRVVFDDRGVLTSVPLAELLPAAFGPAQLHEATR